jgi:hypothetical protein
MPKFRFPYLGAFIVVWVLSFGTQDAWGYYPPLQATVTSYTSNTVTYSVYNPQVQQGHIANHAYLGTVVNLQQHHGVIGWVVQDGTDYYVEWVTFDPARDTFQHGGQGPYTSVSQLQVMDGVVAFVAGVPASLSDPAHLEFKYATYDPAKGGWQNGQYWSPFISGLTIITKDGVVILRYISTISSTNFNNISWDIYDPKLGRWWPSHVGISTYSTTDPITSVFISNATIHYTADELNWIEGYNPSYDFPFLNPWEHNPTKPLAYFVAQPDFGKEPLWVWFTDMSIAGTNWNWDFKDNTSSTSRSPYHTFTSTGIYQVSQQINGPSTYSQPVTVVKSYIFKKKSLPGILNLLLLAD